MSKEPTVDVRCPRCRKETRFLVRAFNLETGKKEHLESCAVNCPECHKVFYVEGENIIARNGKEVNQDAR